MTRACIVTAVGNEGELHLLYWVSDKDAEWGRYESGVGKSEQF
jgi:hypothetical protein